MKYGWLIVCVLLVVQIPLRAEETLDSFLATPARVKDLKLMMLGILSQADEKVAEKNRIEIRKSFWPMRPQAQLTEEQANEAVKDIDAGWNQLAKVVADRKMKELAFVGLDYVLLKRVQDWYFGYITPHGPVLARLSVQYNDNSPLSIHGVRVWTNWDEIKKVSKEIQMPLGSKVLTLTYENKPQASETPSTTP